MADDTTTALQELYLELLSNLNAIAEYDSGSVYCHGYLTALKCAIKMTKRYRDEELA